MGRKLFILFSLISLLLLPAIVTGMNAYSSVPSVPDNSGQNDDGAWKVGALWVENYHDTCCACQPQPDPLVCRHESANNLINVLKNNGFIEEFNIGDCSAKTAYIVDSSLGGLDSYFADRVDLIYVTGHGAPYTFDFCSGGAPGIDCFLSISDVRLGDLDAEWIIFDACRMMETIANNPATTPWRGIFHGLHAMLGFKTDTYDQDKNCFLGVCIPVCGKRTQLFAEYLVDGYDVANAWRRATIESIMDTNIVAGAFGVWDPVTQRYGMYDILYGQNAVVSVDNTSPEYFMGMFWRCG